MKIVALLMAIFWLLVPAAEGNNLPSARLEIWPDTSGSLYDSEDSLVRAFVMTAMTDLIELFNIKEIWVQPWSERKDIWCSPRFRIRVPEIDIPEYRSHTLTPEEKLFKNFRELQEKNDRRDYELSVTKAKDHFRQLLTDSLTGVASYLMSLRQGHSNCTHLYDLVYRLGQEGPNVIAIIISDAQPECDQLSLEIPDKSNGSARVILFLVPSKSDLGSPNLASLMEARKQALLKVAPWLKIFHSYRVLDHSWLKSLK